MGPHRKEIIKKNMKGGGFREGWNTHIRSQKYYVKGSIMTRPFMEVCGGEQRGEEGRLTRPGGKSTLIMHK